MSVCRVRRGIITLPSYAGDRSSHSTGGLGLRPCCKRAAETAHVYIYVRAMFVFACFVWFASLFYSDNILVAHNEFDKQNLELAIAL